jgi:hypothetical protein
MSKKLALIINSLVTSVSGGAIALASYFEPSHMAIVNSAIEVGSGAIITIINLFVTPALLKKADEKAEEKKAE